MGATEIREPKQQRSIEKKNKIIAAGFQLICEKGYYNTNTAEIAKVAGVSTGIVYNYFNDKKDIFIAAIKTYTDKMINPLYDHLSSLKEPYDLPSLLSQFIDIFIKSHDITKSAHEEMMAMSHSDPDIREYFCDFESKTTNKIVELINHLGLKSTNPNEKVHIAFGMIENLCHEIVYHKHEYMNYEIMKEEVINAIVVMLSN